MQHVLHTKSTLITQLKVFLNDLLTVITQAFVCILIT
jgi:hypothetical protein